MVMEHVFETMKNIFKILEIGKIIDKKHEFMRDENSDWKKKEDFLLQEVNRIWNKIDEINKVKNTKQEIRKS